MMCMYVSPPPQSQPALVVRYTTSAHLICLQHALIKLARVTPVDLAVRALMEQCLKKVIESVWILFTVVVRSLSITLS